MKVPSHNVAIEPGLGETYTVSLFLTVLRANLSRLRQFPRAHDFFTRGFSRTSTIFQLGHGRPSSLLQLMSNSHPTTTTTSSSNFQLIFNNALKAYEKRTKMDILAHPLAAELQNCNYPTKILAVLQQQVQELDQSPSSDDRWTKWLDPTVNVLYMLSETLGEGTSPVSLKT